MRAMDEGREKKRRLYAILAVLCLLAAVAGVVTLLIAKERRRKAEEDYARMAQSVNTVATVQEPEEEKADPAEEPAEPEPEPEAEEAEEPEKTEEELLLEEMGAEVPEKEIDWDELHGENEDIYAWLTVPGTLVDHPVLQHPTDNYYYLNRNPDRSYGLPGSLYTENYNAKDFSDPNTVIYGHKLRSGQMFASLHNLEDTELTEENHFFYIYTEDATYVYLIFAVYEYPARHLLLNFDLANDYVFEQYLQDILNKYETRPGGVANVREGMELSAEDRIVTLSTCTWDSSKSYRFLVAGQLLVVL